MRVLFNILIYGTVMIFISYFFLALTCGFVKLLEKVFKWESANDLVPHDDVQ